MSVRVDGLERLGLAGEGTAGPTAVIIVFTLSVLSCSLFLSFKYRRCFGRMRV